MQQYTISHEALTLSYRFLYPSEMSCTLQWTETLKQSDLNNFLFGRRRHAGSGDALWQL